MGRSTAVQTVSRFPGRLRVRTSAGRGNACHAFRGDMDGESALALHVDRVQGASVVELDLREVTFVDSVGLLVLVDLLDAYERTGATVRLTVSSLALPKCFDTVGVVDGVDVHVARPAI